MFIWTCDDPAGNTWTAKLLHKFNDVVWHVSWSITGNILAVSGGDNKVECVYNTLTLNHRNVIFYLLFKMDASENVSVFSFSKEKHC